MYVCVWGVYKLHAHTHTHIHTCIYKIHLCKCFLVTIRPLISSVPIWLWLCPRIFPLKWV